MSKRDTFPHTSTKPRIPSNRWWPKEWRDIWKNRYHHSLISTIIHRLTSCLHTWLIYRFLLYCYQVVLSKQLSQISAIHQIYMVIWELLAQALTRCKQKTILSWNTNKAKASSAKSSCFTNLIGEFEEVSDTVTPSKFLSNTVPKKGGLKGL